MAKRRMQENAGDAGANGGGDMAGGDTAYDAEDPDDFLALQVDLTKCIYELVLESQLPPIIANLVFTLLIEI